MADAPGLPNVEEDEDRRTLVIFGREVSQIPCFRSSLIYGISTGIVGGLATFMKTSRPHYSTNVGLGIMTLTTLAYWFPCRYNHSKELFEYRKIQAAMRDAAIYEGSALEKELDSRARSA